MKRITIYFFCLILLVTDIFCQGIERGTEILQEDIITGKVRALIIGISDYKNLSSEKQLRFADKDAKAFYNFLCSRPDIISKDDIITLYNEEATNANNIYSKVYTLLSESDDNDLVIIFFAGHGNIQNIHGKADDGFLLLHNVYEDGDYIDPSNDVLNIKIWLIRLTRR